MSTANATMESFFLNLEEHLELQPVRPLEIGIDTGRTVNIKIGCKSYYRSDPEQELYQLL